MSSELSPDTESFIAKEIALGAFQTRDDALRGRNYTSEKAPRIDREVR